MEAVVRKSAEQDMAAVALKAFGRIVAEWGLQAGEAAALADMSESTWKRARGGAFAGQLTKDQMLRLSAIIGIYKALKLYFDDPVARHWMVLANHGPLFSGARPVDTLVEDGLPQFLAVRTYLDELRGGA